ncbi:sensor histidine kinase [Bacillus songklensis]|uniref:Oxygen sensor histidine kinase NreB n=1 Tax=Bacillus songklensis TaxID=1069116 RepID=A0ABV8AZU5_9BACI
METLPANNISSYIIQSQEEEIKRIALELHEGVGQTLYSVFTGLQLIETGVEQLAAKGHIREMAQLLEKTIREIRLLSVELHPPTLTTIGLVPAVKSYAKLYTSTYGIVVEIDAIGNQKTIPNQSNIALFRVCQESLANIAKYADTSYAKITFTWEENCVKMEIRDSGKGFDVEKALNKSSGLAAMKERMNLAGGKCLITSKLGEGTSIEISLPLT